jgi:hypothetical protein
MTVEQATLIAAIIAATASAFQIVISAFSSRDAEFRAAHRKILEPHLSDLGFSMHQLLASSKMYMQRYGRQQALANWRNRAEEASHRLKDLRRQVRYPLWGIDEGIRTLTRVFHWVSHLQEHPEAAEVLFIASDKLRQALDEAIRNSYQAGRPPNTIEVWKVNLNVWLLKRKRDEIIRRIGDAALKDQLSEWAPDQD